ncbi:hypothetical protein G6F50_016656 [Rhizopus delemar]|uniref:Uncharacterized protein n=1 Tax=Rhizopus delemar TaxID=936053 RepID=A0A9P6XSW5_9FUNG|nr:hypothetical protein G6F50_016656 [Rhizopus delemar]
MTGVSRTSTSQGGRRYAAAKFGQAQVDGLEAVGVGRPAGVGRDGIDFQRRVGGNDPQVRIGQGGFVEVEGGGLDAVSQLAAKRRRVLQLCGEAVVQAHAPAGLRDDADA